ncbi:N-acyl-D-amino-acid deacylase family protein [Sphingomonas sp. C3-2]|uniref:N-acyl-D-amino-acid deacylase family protein n=1 Tax=Sphingomonas sp. C3-2 TaxID=3062169 RepID=UPI00294B054A|nr:amidohydrolase family protein [Sphingomonas sp. C3-2]WOK38306.1 amidohydrolase family protein [Sphingomonas sp. C3-2]
MDLVLRNGLVCDGSGAEPIIADIAIRGGRIVEIGQVAARGAEEIDATGHVVTPGFVDLHTHYDGQAIWSNRLNPSSQHGVTTAVLGNCGVGFAPCRASDRDRLIGVMEGVEDIPEIVMAEGLSWDWESFPEYLDALDRRPRDIDVAAYLPHSALRVYAMGERGAAREPATPDDIAVMRGLVGAAMDAGALGFATSRQFIHRTCDGDLIPSFDASETELRELVDAMGTDRGVFQIVLDTPHFSWADEVAMMRRVLGQSDRTAMFTLAQGGRDPDDWRNVMAMVHEANASGQSIRPQVFPRPIGIVIGHSISANPFMDRPSFKALPDDFDARITALRDPETRARILGESSTGTMTPLQAMTNNFEQIYVLSDPPNYEPDPADSVAGRARALGLTPEEVAYDMLLEDGGHAMLYVAVGNYAQGTLDPVRDMLLDDATLLGLGDGGAHYGMICDASFPTFMLSHWVRDRETGRLPLAWVVKALTRDAALAIGLRDRGLIAPGMKADLNVIDMDRVRLHKPHVLQDLPAGGRRLTQGADGYVATIVNGTVIQRNGTPTGQSPGRLVRGAQQGACV